MDNISDISGNTLLYQQFILTFFTHITHPSCLTSTDTMTCYLVTFNGISASHAAISYTVISVLSIWTLYRRQYTCLIRKEVMLKGILYFNEIEKVVCQLNMCFFLNKRLRLFKALHMLRNVVLIIRSVRNSTRIWHVFQH